MIAGPTASGKSALAIRYAQLTGGVVVNADSMQVYAGLPILTAQPTLADFSTVPHRLYGHVDPATDYSVGAWAREVERLLPELRGSGRVPIFVGGTGLYFRALASGLDDMPAIPDAIRARQRDAMATEGPASRHALLRRLDPVAADRIRPNDPQRIVRALELIETTGDTLAAIQRGEGRPLVDAPSALKLVLTPDRESLRQRIAIRFRAMIDAGAIEEARLFRERTTMTVGTADKAIGLAELLDHLDGRSSLAAAVERAVARSRQYAKRQDTWFRHQLDASWRRQISNGLEVFPRDQSLGCQPIEDG